MRVFDLRTFKSSSSAFPLFGIGASSFQSPRSLVLCVFYLYSFLLRVFSYDITSLHLSFGLPIFRCPPTSMFSLLHLLQSFSPHGLTISVSLLLFSHLCFLLASGSARRAATADTTAILTSRAPSTRTTSGECSPTVATSSSASTCASTSSCDVLSTHASRTLLRADNDASVTSSRRRHGHWRHPRSPPD